MSESDPSFSDKDSSCQLYTPLEATHAEAEGVDDDLYSENMLSVDFSAPVSGQARNEKIKQMSKNHAALEKCRGIQKIMFQIQMSLRRSPGIPAPQSREVNDKLQEVSQILNCEVSQLVDALMRVTLDQQDTESAMARMSIELNICKARLEDKTQTLTDLEKELALEKKGREKAEQRVEETLQELQRLTADFRKLKETSDGNSGAPPDQDGLIKTLEDTIKHLEEQVNNRRSLWVMKNGNSHSLTKALETLADSVQDKDVIHKSLMSLRSSAGSDDDSPAATRPARNGDGAPLGDFNGRTRLASSYQTAERPPTTVVRSPYSPLQAGPPRAPSVAPHRGFRSPFQQGGSLGSGQFQSRNPSNFSLGSNGAGASQSRVISMGAPIAPPYNRTPSRRGGGTQVQQSRYRPNAPEFHPSNNVNQDSVQSRPGTSMGHLRDNYLGSPQPVARSRYFRGGLQEQHFEGGGVNGGGGGALIGAGRGYGYSQPRMAGVNGNSHSHSNGGSSIVHVTERSVHAWTAQVGAFYGTIRNFVEAHAAEPINAPSVSISDKEIWPILAATYLPLTEAEATSYLDVHLKEPNSKMCLVTRVIIDYVVNLVWVPTAWRGADDATTAALEVLEQDMISTHGQPSTVRQPILDRQAAILDAIMKQCEDNPEFYKMKIEEIAGTLLTSLQPLLNPLSNPHHAYEALEVVAERAWDLSSKILTSRLTFDFRFPEIGSRFSLQSMVPIWPDWLDSHELQSKHWRVALVTTPVITCRNDTGTNISAHSVSLADVICMQ